MGRYIQNFYKPKNPHKYKGRVDQIVYRSSWEYEVMKWLDRHPHVLQWASEEPWFCIPYRHPLRPSSSNLARYYPDFWVRKVNKQGVVETWVVEVKPKKETEAPPSLTGKRAQSKKNLYAQATYVTNKAKWDSADKYCKARGWKFIIFTENQINNLRG